MSEPHDVVKLLLKRMDSHPEEFRGDGYVADGVLSRWYSFIEAIKIHGNDTDRAALNEALRNVKLNEIHEQVMDELCNGEERRRKEEEEREYERQMLRQGGLVQQQKAYVSQLQGMIGQVYGGGGGGGGGAGIVGQGAYDYDLDKYRNTPTGSITSALPVANGGTDNTIINQIKNMLKKGK